MQKEIFSTAPGLYYYRGRYWSAMAWSKLSKQPPGKDAPPSAEKQSSACGQTEESPVGASEQAGEPTAAASR